MSQEKLQKLQRSIEREGRYPPLIIRSHPGIPGEYQLLDGHHRWEVLQRAGHKEALCYLWDCDEETALLLLATLNRLEGEDVPTKRADLLREIAGLLPADELALLLPEDASSINDTLSLFALDGSQLLWTDVSIRGQARRANG
jgi:ParB-like chromosome segregation protein Spo0J